MYALMRGLWRHGGFESGKYVGNREGAPASGRDAVLRHTWRFEVQVHGVEIEATEVPIYDNSLLSTSK